ncbi:hypothetical protein [Conyzicola lurida]|uniref:hypothetical protein n=1 Tax=Conyzicola lurida TaxID=1172621 RepID=UPI001606FC35|nr:hypothetical protein [Conyzicola lurida]
MDRSSSEKRLGKPGLTIGWPALSLGLGILATGSLGTLAVVATISEVDALSTVALALAILAFAAQIVVSLSQAQGQAHQQTEIGRVNAETRGLLAQITAQSDSLLANQREQFTKVLDAALGSDLIRNAVTEVATADGDDAENPMTPGENDSAPSIDVDALSENLQKTLKTAFENVSASRTAQRSAGSPPRIPDSDRFSDLLDSVKSLPDADHDGKRAFEVFKSLSPLELSTLSSRAYSDLDKARRGRQPEGVLRNVTNLTPATQRLVDLGLIEFTERTRPAETWTRRITPLGWKVVRFLLGRGDMSAFTG